MINSVIQEEKEKYAIPVHSLEYLHQAPNDLVQFTISDGQFLEMLLLRIWGETIKLASLKKIIDNEAENKLKREITKLEEDQDIFANNLLEDKKKELENLRESLIKGQIIRSRAQ